MSSGDVLHSLEKTPLGKPLQGQRVCVTGTLTAMTHADFAALIQVCGGQFVSQPSRDGCLLVVGPDGWPASDESASACFLRARELHDSGSPIEFLSEEDFFSRIGLLERKGCLGGRHTIAELSRLTGVSAASLRRWTRLGLIEPVETIHQFAYFAFSEIISVRRLSELVKAGASPTRIRQSLDRFRAWISSPDISLSQLSLVARSGQILMRRNNILVEPSGQMHFDFDAEIEVESAVLSFPASVEGSPPQFDSLFDLGLALEDQRRFSDAAVAYRQARALLPDDVAVHFNLGNVLYELGEFDLSVDSYRQAIRFDPQYAEAWNNLGFVLWRTGQLTDAMQAFRRALELLPDYADARTNLQSVQEKLASITFRIVS